MPRAAANVVKWIAAAAPAIVRDLVAMAGAALVSYGSWLVFAPAGYITAGLMLLSATIFSARRSA